ncbi:MULTISPECIES: hypothetical protein [Paenibacillus]|uniref:Uncharacterized protein n=1 Tax=Paenibacillus sabinae T27 TaxID=1268072 RepID=X4ZKG5_9BACL|nr:MULTISPECIES: hypothetical protein [Paenibacillus]AHV97205.1 hypothetical protein PSAB_11385 [Paenibacillus sabinae T27]NJJ38896.1 hypothetical protein [Paenibacillus apii]
MTLPVHNLMAFNQQYFRAQPPVAFKREAVQEKSLSFQEILNEKMSSGGTALKK